MSKLLLFAIFAWFLFESSFAQSSTTTSYTYTQETKLTYTRWTRVYEYLHDDCTFDMAVQAEIEDIKAKIVAGDVGICNTFASYGSVLSVGGILNLNVALNADINANVGLFTTGGLYVDVGLAAKARLDLLGLLNVDVGLGLGVAADVYLGADVVAFAAARRKELISVELLADLVALASAEARLQRQVDVINITSVLEVQLSLSGLLGGVLGLLGGGVSCSTVRSSGLLSVILNPVDAAAVIRANVLLAAQARINLIDRLTVRLPELALRVTADAALRVRAGLTLPVVIGDLHLRTRQFFLERVARRIHTFEELKVSFGINAGVSLVYCKRFRDFFGDYIQDPAILTSMKIDIQAIDSSKVVQLTISYRVDPAVFTTFSTKVTYVAKQFAYAFAHPYEVKVISQTTTSTVVQLHSAPAFTPSQVIPFNYNDHYNCLTNGSGVPPPDTVDPDWTAVVTAKAEKITTMKSTVQSSYTTYNSVIPTADSSAQAYLKTATETYSKVDTTTITTELRNYATEPFDVVVLKRRAIAAAAQVELTVGSVKAKIQEDYERIKVTAATLGRLEAGLTVQYLDLINTIPASACALSADVLVALNSDLIVKLNADVNCQPVVPILLKALPIKQQLLVAIQARKAHVSTTAIVSANIATSLKQLDDVSVSISTTVSDNFQTPKVAVQLHTLWDSIEYRGALEKCLLSLNHGLFVGLSVNVNVLSNFRRVHRVSAQAGLTVNYQVARENLAAQLPLCIAQISGGDLFYLRVKAQLGSIKRGALQNTIEASQETDTSAPVGSTTGSNTPSTPSSTTGSDTPSTPSSTTGSNTPSTPSSTTGSSTPSTPSSTTGSETPSTPSSTTGSNTPSTPSSTTGSSTPSTPSSTTGSNTPSTPSSTTGSETPSTPSSTTGSNTPSTPSSTTGSSTPSTPSVSTSTTGSSETSPSGKDGIMSSTVGGAPLVVVLGAIGAALIVFIVVVVACVVVRRRAGALEMV